MKQLDKNSSLADEIDERTETEADLANGGQEPVVEKKLGLDASDMAMTIQASVAQNLERNESQDKIVSQDGSVDQLNENKVELESF